MKLSVIIITKNEATNIGACIDSANFADEIIVVDSGSSDDTVAIALRYGAVVIETTNWSGFGAQKNHALDAASGEWILSIDADERISPALRNEILTAINQPSHNAYNIPRLSNFCGHFVHHSGWFPDYVVRLFQRGAGLFSDDLVHEKMIIASPNLGCLRNHLIHYSYPDDDTYLRKLQQYSSLGAQQAYLAGKRCGLTAAILHGIAAFIRSFLFKRGFLDGRVGLMVAISSAESSYHKYLKLMLIADSKSGYSISDKR